ncbi:MAG TPA: hypothetical protein GX403_18915, partial [Rhodocyclaceae bacterium]|nr:hypothetical protein [Rhodocyclaceae bacterium]
AAAEIGGALFTLAEYELESGRMQWHAPLAADGALHAGGHLAAAPARAGRHPETATVTAGNTIR